MTQIIREENVWEDALAGLVASLAVTQTTILPVYYQDNWSILEKQSSLWYPWKLDGTDHQVFGSRGATRGWNSNTLDHN